MLISDKIEQRELPGIDRGTTHCENGQFSKEIDVLNIAASKYTKQKPELKG